jgi:hypothetical protein
MAFALALTVIFGLFALRDGGHNEAFCDAAWLAAGLRLNEQTSPASFEARCLFLVPFSGR